MGDHASALPDMETALAPARSWNDLTLQFHALCGLGTLANLRATFMLGGVDALRRSLGFQTYQTLERRVFQRTRHDLQRVSGDERFQRAWDEEAALSVQSLIEPGSELAAACAAPVAQSG